MIVHFSGICRIRCLLLVALGLLTAILPAQAAPPANRNFQSTWARTDQPVAQLVVSRTWMWGPEATGGALVEPYGESPDGQRVVQYYDKSRMEITQPGGDAGAPWYVTNGLLVLELITGRLQLGDNSFEQHEGAHATVAGDFDDAEGPTYAAMTTLLDQPPHAAGEVIISGLEWYGGSPSQPRYLGYRGFPEYAVYNVTAATHVPETNHTVATPFWEFMTSTGTVYENGAYIDAALFLNPFYATGFPITEPNWDMIKVGGVVKAVLIQCFERRCLTYTPDNAPEWRVESGNVGAHNYQWRYVQLGQTPQPAPIATTGDVRIVAINADPPGDEDTDEYVDIQNFAGEPIDLTGWQLKDAATATFTFPAGFVIGVDATVRIHICDGANSATDLYWGRCAAAWNNGGDTGYLYNLAGQLVSEHGY